MQLIGRGYEKDRDDFLCFENEFEFDSRLFKFLIPGDGSNTTD